MYSPQARTDRLTIRELIDETLVYDLERNKAHCLNRTVALVWRHCDGQHSEAALAEILQRELHLTDGQALVQLALEQLGRRHLLVQAPVVAENTRTTRRDMLRKLAAATVALPLIMTITAQRVAASVKGLGQSCDPVRDACFHSCPTGQIATCLSGTCQCTTITLAGCPNAGKKCIVGSTDNGGCGPNCTCPAGTCV